MDVDSVCGDAAMHRRAAPYSQGGRMVGAQFAQVVRFADFSFGHIHFDDAEIGIQVSIITINHDAVHVLSTDSFGIER